MSIQTEMGKLGEDMTARFLRKRGWLILRRNYITKFGELDIIAEKGEYILFVEVKTREENSPITGQGAVDRRKQRRIVLSAFEVLQKLMVERSYRFDIAQVTYSVSEDGELRTSLHYIENAFNEEVLDNSKPF